MEAEPVREGVQARSLADGDYARPVWMDWPDCHERAAVIARPGTECRAKAVWVEAVVAADPLDSTDWRLPESRD